MIVGPLAALKLAVENHGNYAFVVADIDQACLGQTALALGVLFRQDVAFIGFLALDLS